MVNSATQDRNITLAEHPTQGLTPAKPLRRVIVAVQYGRQSCEIRIAISQASETGSVRGFDLGEIVRLYCPRFPERDTYFQSSKQEGIRAAVQKILQLLMKFGKGVVPQQRSRNFVQQK